MLPAHSTGHPGSKETPVKQDTYLMSFSSQPINKY